MLITEESSTLGIPGLELNGELRIPGGSMPVGGTVIGLLTRLEGSFVEIGFIIWLNAGAFVIPGILSARALVDVASDN